MLANQDPPSSNRQGTLNLIAQAGLPVTSLVPEDLAVPCSSRGFQVTDKILISHWIPAFNRDFIAGFGIQSILSLDGKVTPELAAALGVRKIYSYNMPDGKGTTPDMIRRLVGELQELVTQHPAVLVQCNAGQSRSPSIVAAYLAMHEGLSLGEALHLVRQARSPERLVKYWSETLQAIHQALEDT